MEFIDARIHGLECPTAALSGPGVFADQPLWSAAYEVAAVVELDSEIMALNLNVMEHDRARLKDLELFRECAGFAYADLLHV